MKKDKMANTTQFYIDGQWVDPVVKNTIDVIDPATEEPFTTLAVGSAADVNRAVAAAKRAYKSVDEAVAIANDTVYGLAAYVQSGDLENARSVARRLRAGTVRVNYPSWNVFAPFGGYKQSGNGREYADFGIAEFLEIKGIVGFTPA
jgi:acyl-CoA reductase-like NAD-dependent aldehyde dehydrogenase